MTADLITEAEEIRQQIDHDIDAEDRAGNPGSEYAVVNGELVKVGNSEAIGLDGRESE